MANYVLGILEKNQVRKTVVNWHVLQWRSRKILEDDLKKNSKPYHSAIKKLITGAAKTRIEHRKMDEEKLEHLKIK